jgi:5,10-methylene-tetrahydrofolate dehydrogenase/methenyl tetrahydrofolate cyclohydrolase
MTAKILNGTEIAARLRAELATQVSAFTAERGYPPGLGVVLVGDNPASHAYVRMKKRADTLQTGYGNVSGIAQIGTNNKAVADQDGYNNTSGIIQVGNGQDVTVRQRGEGNISVVVQSGYN